MFRKRCRVKPTREIAIMSVITHKGEETYGSFRGDVHAAGDAPSQDRSVPDAVIRRILTHDLRAERRQPPGLELRDRP
jgi:hypothetical protein